MALNTISLFTGAGGLDLGFEAAGFRTRLAVDMLPEAVATLLKNDSKRAVFGPPEFSGDVTKLHPDEIYRMSGLKPGQVDMMIGGPPCQPFSVAAAQRFLRDDSKFKRVGFESEDKGQLIFRYAELIKALKPRAFLIENVPGILSIDGGTGISVVYETLSEAGYNMSAPFVLNTADFGVPQFRKRAFVIGTLNGPSVEPPLATHSELASLFTRQHVSVAQALIGASNIPLNHELRTHKAESIDRYKKIPVGAREKLGRIDRLDPARPSKTIIAGGTKGGGRSHLHPYVARTLSVRECARLQTFPDDYEFVGSTARQFTLVGNAVPPLMAEVLARLIGEKVFGKKYPKKLSLEINSIEQSLAEERLSKDAYSEQKSTPYVE